MSDTKFTKGEWFADSSSFGSPFVECDSEIIAEVYELPNAHLIAAAPEMYEILSEVSKLRDQSMNDAVFWLLDNTDDILQLLKKARGEHV